MADEQAQPKTTERKPVSAGGPRSGFRHSASRGQGNDRTGGRNERGGFRGQGGQRGRAPSRRRSDGEGNRSEYDHKVIDVRRVARVVSGGRRFTFRVSLVLGDHKGLVGVGIGKGADTALAIAKATRDAKKKMIRIPFTNTASIPHETRAKYASSIVTLFPAPGKGLVAGSSIRTVLSLAGATNISSKILSRSKNKLNNARAAIEALRILKAPRAPKAKEVKAKVETV